ncbi:PE family protein [Mycobacterium sp. TY815]|uniref:PE family protein n=1 Tax=Mycobacterium sp. TY815 TaxID=3050581 RepID=UPI0027419202|nr:PE family protein [Mycobacterium sp. TY815]MDP7705550.1 PE family protein [Mycobacterium sp. TY815]
MSFVFVEPQIMSAFGADLSGIGSALGAANATAAASTTGVLSAAADEVSVQIAALFSENAAGYQQVSAQVAASYERFVQAVTAGAGAYAAAEANTVQALVNGLAAPSVSFEGLGQAWAGFTANIVNAQVSFNQSLVGTEVALRQALFGGGNAVSNAVDTGLNFANSFVGGGQQAVNLLLGAQVPANFNTSLVINSALDANVGPGLFSGAFSGALSGLGAQLNAALSGSLSGGLPDFSTLGNAFAANVNAGLTSLAQTGGMLATSLSSGLAGLAQTGGTLAANLSAALTGLPSFDITLPALTGGFTANLPALVADITGGFSGLGTQLSAALNGALSGNFALPNFNFALPNFNFALPNFALPDFNFAVPNFAALTQAGATLAGNISTGLANLNLSLPALGGQVSAALSGAFNGDTTGVTALVNAVAALPTTGLAGFEQLQSGMLGGLVSNEIAFNEALVANEVALFGAPALAGPLGYAVNAGNLLVGTGEQLVNAVIGAPAAGLTSSLIVNGALEAPDFPIGGGLTGVAHQLLSLNTAVGGVPGLDTSLLAQLNLTPASLQGLVDSQLAFNANLVANEQLFQTMVFGTGGALNGAVNNAFNGLNLLLVGTPQGVVNALLGAPAVDLTGSLLVTAPGDVFGGVTAGGLLGAFEQKWLFDAAVLSSLFSPIQVTLTGGLPSLLANINATLTGVLTGTGTIGGTVGGTIGGDIDTNL